MIYKGREIYAIANVSGYFAVTEDGNVAVELGPTEVYSANPQDILFASDAVSHFYETIEQIKEAIDRVSALPNQEEK